jgi:hypothetical protein
MRLRHEKAVEVPEIRDVELVTSIPKVRTEEIPKRHSKVSIRPQEVYEDVPMKVIHESPKRVSKTEHCDLVTQLPVKDVQQREKKVSKPVPIVGERIEWVPVEVAEECVERVPKIRTVDAIRQELVPVVREELRKIPRVTMKYIPETIEVGHLEDAGKIKSCGISGTNHVLQRTTKRLVTARDSREMQDATSLQGLLLQRDGRRSLSEGRVTYGSADSIIYKRSPGGDWAPWVAAKSDHRSASTPRR